MKDYIDEKSEEMLKNNRSNNELAERLTELIKIIRMGDVSLNVDTLTVTKQDPKIAGLILSRILIIDQIELFPDKFNPL